MHKHRATKRHKYVPTSHRLDKPTPRRTRRVIVACAALISLVAGPAGAYTIHRGDTLGRIAARHGTTIGCLARVNHIPNVNLIYAGRHLRISHCHGSTRHRAPSRSAARGGVHYESGPIPAAGAWVPQGGYGHPTWDINVNGSGDCGDPVRSAVTGRVSGTWYWNYSYGHHIEIGSTLYAHLSRIDVHPGQFVVRGQVIGAVGMTGNATGCHLHFEVGR